MSLLKIESLNKNFGGLAALKRVTLEISQGRIHGLIGPNGSGKTTLFNVVSGIYKAEAGGIFFKEREITKLPHYKITYLGIARTFQEIQLFYDMTVLENVMVGCQRLTKADMFGAFLRPKWVREEETFIHEKARECLAFVGLLDCESELARNISYGHQRLLEIARALASEPELLLLDEPAAGMNPSEIRDLMDHIEKIRETGITILLVEHNMRIVMNICEEIAVLNYGRLIACGKPEEVQSNEQVIEAYLGGTKKVC